MPGAPLAQDTVLHGVIYLKGETQYPDIMYDALKEKARSVKNVHEHPIFKAEKTQPVAPPAPTSVLEVPTPNVVVQSQSSSEGLSSDFPYRDAFITAGYDTLAKVEALTDLTDIDGIGPTREAEVQTYIAGLNVDTPEDES